MTQKYDVIVIGAGLGGLSAAGYLAKAGKKTLLLEHHTVPGGYAHEFRRGHYRFEVSLHALDGAAPGGWVYPILKELEVMEQVNFIRLDPFYSVRFPDGEFTASANPFEYETELIRRFPDEADGIRQLIDAMVKTYYEVRRFSADGELNRRPPMAEMPAVYPNMLKAMATTWGDFMAEYLSDPKVKAVFTTLWAYYGLPPSQLPAATFIFPWVSYHLFGGYYPEGGSMAMSRALEATIKKYGGEIRYRQTVKRIEIQDGKAVAVETEQGLRAEAEAIISNANAPDTMLKFVGRENLPQKYVRQVEKPKAAASNVVVYLGLNRDLRAEWPHHEFFVSDGYDIEAGYAGMMAGDFEKVDFGVSLYNLLDPGCAPEGGSVLVLTTLADWDYAEQWGTGGKLENYRQNPHYLELKEDAADKLIHRTEKLIPGLREAIVYQEVATPLTNHRFTRNPGGSIYGSEQTIDNMYLNRLKDKTPIPNLFLAGAWTFGGGQSAAMMSGKNVSQMALAFLNGEATVDLTGAEASDGRRTTNDELKKQPETQNQKPETLNLKQTLTGMALVFNPDAAGDLTGDIQFNVSGDEPGDYFLRIADGKCAFNEGASMAPKLTINTPSEVWLAISRGELDGQTAFMQQKYKVEGDFGLLMKMSKMFK